MENRVIEALRREGKPQAPQTLIEEFEEEERDAAAMWNACFLKAG